MLLPVVILVICGVVSVPTDLWGQNNDRTSQSGETGSRTLAPIIGSTGPAGPQEPVVAQPPVVVQPPAGSQEPAAAQAKAAAKEPATIVVAPGPGGVMIACQDPEILNEFEQMLNNLAAGAATGGPELTIFYLKYAKAEPVKATLEKVFGSGMTTTSGTSSGGGFFGGLANAALGDTGGGILGSLLGGESTITPTGTLKITADSRLNALIVQANATDVATIEQLLKILDQKESPEEVLAVPKARIIPLQNMQADEVADIVRQVYQDRMVAGMGGLPGQSGQMPNPQQLMQMMMGGGGRRGGPGGFGGMGGMGGRRGQGQADDVQKMTIGVDYRTNSVILSAPEPLCSEVSQLIEQLDEGALAESTQTMRVVTLHKASSNTVQQALSAIVGGGVQFGSTGGMGPGGMPMQGGRFGQQQMMGQMRGTRGAGGRQGGFMPGGYGATGAYPGGYMSGGNQGGGRSGRTSMGGYPGGYTGGYGATGGYPGGGRSGRSSTGGYPGGGGFPGGGMPSGGGFPGGGRPTGGSGFRSGGGFPSGGGMPSGSSGSFRGPTGGRGR
jgi:hypothetical protein